MRDGTADHRPPEKAILALGGGGGGGGAESSTDRTKIVKCWLRRVKQFWGDNPRRGKTVLLSIYLPKAKLVNK